MTRWNKGGEVVERLIDDRHLEEVPADADTVNRLVETARRHISSASSNADSDPEGAFALAYDAARKSATALLSHQGLRPTSAGGQPRSCSPFNWLFRVDLAGTPVFSAAMLVG